MVAMHLGGTRAVRFHTMAAGGLDLGQLEAVAARVRPLRWHLEICIDASRLPQEGC